MFRYLPLIVKNCWRNRRRTILTVASIECPCAAGVMIAMYHALYLSDATPEQALRLVTRKPHLADVPAAGILRARDQADSGCTRSMISQWFGGTYKDPKNFFARFAVEPEKLFAIYSELKIPEDQRLAFVRDRTGCVVGATSSASTTSASAIASPWWGTSSRELRVHRAGNLRQSPQQRDPLFQPRVPGADPYRAAARKCGYLSSP